MRTNVLLAWLLVAGSCSPPGRGGRPPGPNPDPTALPTPSPSPGPSACAAAGLSCAAGEICREGRCLTPLCAEAESKRAQFGCEFFAADTDNLDNDDKMPFVLYVGNPGSEPAAVVVERRSGAGWTKVRSLDVPGQSQGRIVPPDSHVEGSGPGTALRLRSTRPVAVLQTNSDHASYLISSSSSNMVLPVHALGRSYVAVTLAQGKEYFGEIGRALITIVASRDETTVRVRPSAGVLGGPGVPAMGAGEVFEVTLREGELVQLASRSLGDDLTGTVVDASRPVAVFAGNVCVQFGNPSATCEKVEEQLLPSHAAGTTFVAADPGWQLMPEVTQARWRVVATEDDTEVTFEAGTGVTLTPPSLRLARGEWGEVLASAKASAALQHPDFVARANRPVHLVGFGFRLWHAAAIGIPTAQYLPEYWVAAPTNFTNELVLMREAGHEVRLDGAPVPASKFAPVGAGFEIARVPICKDCPLMVTGEKVGIAMSGVSDCGQLHAYAAGMAFRCLNATAGCP